MRKQSTSLKHTFYKKQVRNILGMNPKIDPKSIDDYLAIGGYSSLAKALLEMKPQEVLEEVKKAESAGKGWRIRQA